MLTLELVQDQSTWTMLDAVAMKIISLTALIVQLLTVLITTYITLVSGVKVSGILFASTDSDNVNDE